MGANESALATQVSSLADELANIEEKLSSFHEAQLHHSPPERLPSAPTAPQPPQCLLFGATLLLGSARVLVGPVIGKVTADSCNVLVEVDRDCKLTLHVCLFTEECPTGRQVFTSSQRLQRNRPAVFRVSGELRKSRRYGVCFSGLCREDALSRTGSFRTLAEDRPIEILAVSSAAPLRHKASLPNPWVAVHNRVVKGEVDFLLHLGGQVDLRAVMARCAVLLRGGEALEEGELGKYEELRKARVEVDIEEKIREEYRRTWNAPPLREVLACCSNLMLWSEEELRLFDARLDREACLRNRELLYPPLLLRIARKVYIEYQCAPWMDAAEEHEDNAAAEGRESGFLDRGVVMVSPQLGFFSIDLTGCRVDVDGGPLPWPEGGFVQRRLLSRLEEDLRAHTNLKTLVVVCDRPFVSAPKHILMKHRSELQSNSNSDAHLLQEQWNSNEEDLEKLLEVLFGWKCGAEVLLLCGSGHLQTFKSGCETTITMSKSPNRRVIRQITTSAMFDTRRTIPLEIPSNFQLSNGCAVLHSFPSSAAKTFAVISVHNGLQEKKLETSLARYATDGHEIAHLLLGPVVGKVTSNEAILLMETSQNAYVTCTVRDSFTEETKVIMKLLEGRQAQTFHFTCLKPERIYTVTIEGTSVPSDVSVASFKTMPDPIHAVNKVPHALDVIIVNECKPFSAVNDAWSAVQQIRSSYEILLHLGGQIDLEVVAEELCRIVDKTPTQPLSCEEKEEMERAMEEAICEAYRTAWNQPAKQRLLRSGCNLMLVCEMDIKPPEAFIVNEDLRPHCNTIRACALRVARRLQLSLHGCEDSRYGSSVHVFGPLGFLYLDLLHARINGEARALSRADWQNLESALKATEVNNLVVVSEHAVVDDSPVDAEARVKMEPLARHGWPFHQRECAYLLELLFAWKAQGSDRHVLITAASPVSGFRTTVRLEDTDMQLDQIVAGPMIETASSSLFPFSKSGSFASSVDRKGQVKYRFSYKHIMEWEKQNAFVVARMGEDSIILELDSGLPKRDKYLNLPVWLVAALVNSQHSAERRQIRQQGVTERRKEREAAEQAITEMKEEHPELEIFPAVEDEDAEGDGLGGLIQLKWISLDTTMFPQECKTALEELGKRFDTKSVIRTVEELFETYKDEAGVKQEEVIKLLLCFLGEMDERNVGLQDVAHVPLEKTWLEDLATFTAGLAWKEERAEKLTLEECRALVKLFLALVVVANSFWP